MSDKIALPDGEWVILRDPRAIPNSARRRLRAVSLPCYKLHPKLVKTGPDGKEHPKTMVEVYLACSPEELDLIDNMQSRFILEYVERWSLEDRDVPTTLEEVEDLPTALYDALALATTNRGEGGVEIDVDDVKDPASPTVPSED